jgi:hypothetical protein
MLTRPNLFCCVNFMANQTLLDNVKRLQTWDRAYLASRLADWKAKYVKADAYGCKISATTDSNGYATITLCRTVFNKQDKWHVRAYTLEAFLLQRLPSVDELLRVKHPVASHLCGRGANGCSTLEHIVFGESQKVNKERDAKGCATAVHCPHCSRDFFTACKGHAEGIQQCLSLVIHKPKRQRLEEIASLIHRLEEEKAALEADEQINE